MKGLFSALFALLVLAKDKKFYYPPTALKTYGPGEIHAVPPKFEDDRAFALGEIAKSVGLPLESLKVTKAYQDKNSVTHLYVSEQINGIEVTNHNAAIHVRNKQIIAQSSSFRPSLSKRDVPTAQNISLKEAIALAQAEISAERDNIPAKQSYLLKPSGDLALVHQFQLKNVEELIFCEVSVDAVNGEILQVVNYVAQFSIKAIEFTNNDPTDGFKVIGDESDKIASPLGWNDDGTNKYTNTTGNNAISSNNGKYVDGGEELRFDFNFNGTADPTDPENIKASIVNTFYVVNKVHDIFYHFGFDEVAGNFQTSNFGKGGEENDSVKILNHYMNRTNNAFFVTPPDGQPGEMWMYIWNRTPIRRDSGLENSVVIHEMAHGLTARLTGGPMNVNCLQGYVYGGLSEGWSDIISFILTRNGTEKREENYVIGEYVTGSETGIRKWPLSVDMNINPLTFNSLTTVLKNTHAIGVLWSVTLFEIYWDLVEKYGFSSNFYDADQSAGNIMLLKIIITGLITQDCNPSFLKARSAFLSGDDQNFFGVNQCLIWKSFAKRGMGVNAKEDIGDFGFVNEVIESYDVPESCGGP